MLIPLLLPLPMHLIFLPSVLPASVSFDPDRFIIVLYTYSYSLIHSSVEGGIRNGQLPSIYLGYSAEENRTE